MPRIKCRDCFGDGVEPGTSHTECDTCRGTGTKVVPFDMLDDFMASGHAATATMITTKDRRLLRSLHIRSDNL